MKADRNLPEFILSLAVLALFIALELVTKGWPSAVSLVCFYAGLLAAFELGRRGDEMRLASKIGLAAVCGLLLGLSGAGSGCGKLGIKSLAGGSCGGEDDATMSYHPFHPAYDTRPDCTECGDAIDNPEQSLCGSCSRQAEVDAGAELYEAGKPYEACTNAAQREGWADAEWEYERNRPAEAEESEEA